MQANYKLIVHREMAAKMGLSPKDIAQAVALYGGGIKVGRTLYKKERDYDIYLYSKKSVLITPSDLHKITLYNSKGNAINLDSVASIKIIADSEAITTYNGEYSLIFETTPSISLSRATSLFLSVLKPALPKGAKVATLGQVKQMGNAVHSILIAMMMAIVLLYFVLSAQFDSFYLPTIFLIAQPMAIVMVVYVLHFSGLGFNYFLFDGYFLIDWA